MDFGKVESEEKNQQKGLPVDVAEFIDLYKEFQITLARIGDLARKGADTAHEAGRARRLEGKVDSAWQRMDEGTRERLWRIMVDEGVLPVRVREVTELFGGKVVSLTSDPIT